MEDKYYICLQPECKVAFPKYPTLALHYAGKHRGTKSPPREQCEVTELPEGYTLKEAHEKPPAVSTATDTPKETPTQSNIYRESPEPTNILKKILDSYPGLEKAAAGEIMDWVQYEGSLHPMQVRHLLTQLAGVPKGAPDIISQKYALALQKAAREGQQEVQMVISGWGGGWGSPNRSTSNPLFTMPGQGGGTMFPFGFNAGSPLAPYPGMFWPGDTNPNKPGNQEAAVDPETKKRLEAIEKNQSDTAKAIETLINKMTETEEQKKEAALNARLEKLENLIVEVANSPKTDEQKDKALEAILVELKETRAEVSKIKEDAAQSKISSLEASIKTLSDDIANRNQQRVDQLERDLSEAKNKPATGRTEMDFLGDVTNKVLDTAKDAGKDIKSFLMSGQNKERFNPQRGDITVRKASGEKIAEAMETEAAIAAAEEAYLKT